MSKRNIAKFFKNVGLLITYLLCCALLVGKTTHSYSHMWLVIPLAMVIPFIVLGWKAIAGKIRCHKDKGNHEND